jgi:hypothetical protein
MTDRAQSKLSPQALGAVRRRAEDQCRRALASGYEREARIWRFVTDQVLEHNNPSPYEAMVGLKRLPVTIDEFVESPEFLGGRIEVWPALVADLRAMNPDVFAGEAPVHEALLGGATGTGKTTLALVTNLYQLYVFTCLRDPQGLFGLSSSTPIVFLFQSVTPAVTRRVIYGPFRETFEAMPYARRWLAWNSGRTSSLELEGGIHVVPDVANVRTMTGQAVAGGILDEVNFMAVVENSRRTPGPRGLGGHYDQAEEVYRTLSRRRKSRFTTRGISIGSLTIISSTRYRGDFLDRRIAEVERLNEQNVVVVRHRRYDVAPQDRYSGETFPLLVGNEAYATRVLEAGDQPPEGARVEQVPIEYEVDFRRDPENALRDIVGLATDTINPFLCQRHKIVDAILAGREEGIGQWVDKSDVDLVVDGLPQWNEDAIPQDRETPRFIHVDLSLTHDRCGIAIVKCAGHVDREGPAGSVESLPHFIVESAITIQPSDEAELIITELRSWLMQLVTYYGVNVAMVTYDGFQSKESIQVLRRSGIQSKVVSVDATTEPYDYLKACFYQNRIAVVESDVLQQELAQLEFNAQKNKIDHPPRGSKDLADAVCGAVFSAGQARSVRRGTGYFEADGDRTLVQQTRERPAGRPRRKGGALRSSKITMKSIKQRLHDDSRALRAKEDEDFKKRYDR